METLLIILLQVSLLWIRLPSLGGQSTCTTIWYTQFCYSKYYVKSPNGSCNDVPSEATCETLDYYMERANDTFNRDKVAVYIYFLPGVHTTTYKNIHISGLQYITLTTYIEGSTVFVCIDVTVVDVYGILTLEGIILSASGKCDSPKIILSRVSIVLIDSARGG